MNWLDDQITKAAGEMEGSNTLRQFRKTIEDKLAGTPITDWETLFWTRGIKRGLIHLNSHWFRLGSGRQSSFSFFVRNENGLLVGLRREAITQAAVYVALVTHYGYERNLVRFEFDYLDVALQDENGRVTLYAETKASDKTLLKLVQDLSTLYRDGLPFLDLEEDEIPPDAWQKAAHILRNKPLYFWAVSPGIRAAYSVVYTGAGFQLCPAKDIPFRRDLGLFSSMETAV